MGQDKVIQLTQAFLDYRHVFPYNVKNSWSESGEPDQAGQLLHEAISPCILTPAHK